MKKMKFELNARTLFLIGATLQAASGVFALFFPTEFMRFYSFPEMGSQTHSLMQLLLGMFGMFSLHSAAQMCQFSFTCTRSQMNLTAITCLLWGIFHTCGTFMAPVGLSVPKGATLAMMAPRFFWLIYSFVNFYFFSTLPDGGKQKPAHNGSPNLAYKILIILYAMMFVQNSYYGKEQVSMYFPGSNWSAHGEEMNWTVRMGAMLGMFCFGLLMNTLNLSTTANDEQKRVEFRMCLMWLGFILLNIFLPAWKNRFLSLGGDQKGQIFWGGVWAIPTYMLWSELPAKKVLADKAE